MAPASSASGIDIILVSIFSVCMFLYTTRKTDAFQTDSSITKYKVEGKVCSVHDEPCKRSYRRTFECKCPNMRALCVSPGKYYDGRCIPEAWLMYGRLWTQP